MAHAFDQSSPSDLMLQHLGEPVRPLPPKPATNEKKFDPKKAGPFAPPPSARKRPQSNSPVDNKPQPDRPQKSFGAPETEVRSHSFAKRFIPAFTGVLAVLLLQWIWTAGDLSAAWSLVVSGSPYPWILYTGMGCVVLWCMLLVSLTAAFVDRNPWRNWLTGIALYACVALAAEGVRHQWPHENSRVFQMSEMAWAPGAMAPSVLHREAAHHARNAQAKLKEQQRLVNKDHELAMAAARKEADALKVRSAELQTQAELKRIRENNRIQEQLRHQADESAWQLKRIRELEKLNLELQTKMRNIKSLMPKVIADAEKRGADKKHAEFTEYVLRTNREIEQLKSKAAATSE